MQLYPKDQECLNSKVITSINCLTLTMPPKKKAEKKVEIVKPRRRATQKRWGTTVEERNAERFFQALAAPGVSEPMAFPDGFAATTLVKHKMRYTITLVADSVNSKLNGGFIIRPSLGDFMLHCSSSAADVFTWATDDHPAISTYSADFLFYRCTALSYTLKDTGALLDRGATVYETLLPYNQVPVAGTSVFTTLGDIPRTQVCSSTDACISERPVEKVWLPMTFGPPIATTTDFHPAGLSLRVVDATNLEDQILCCAITAPAGSTDSFYVDIVSHWEFIPYYANFSLFDPKLVIGSPDAIHKVANKIEIASPTLSTASGDNFKQVVGRVIPRVKAAVKKKGGFIADVASGIGDIIQVGKKIWEFAGPIISLLSGVHRHALSLSPKIQRGIHLRHKLAIESNAISPYRSYDDLYDAVEDYCSAASLANPLAPPSAKESTHEHKAWSPRRE